MNDNKIFISLLVAFLVLIAALAIYGGTSGNSFEAEMMPYDFVNFTMDIPKGTYLNEDINDNFSSFSDVNNQFSITYMNSDGIYEDMLDFYNSSANSSSLNSLEVDNDLVIAHFTNGEIVDLSFNNVVLKGSNNQVVLLEGNDVNLLKKMADTLNFNNQ